MGRQMRMGQVRITVSTWLRPLPQPIEQEVMRSRLNDAHSLYASNGRGIRSNQRNRCRIPQLGTGQKNGIQPPTTPAVVARMAECRGSWPRGPGTIHIQPTVSLGLGAQP
jgi:hypothetical protein